MKNKSHLLTDIEAFLAKTKMGHAYFGKVAAGNSELVSRLRGGGRVWPETEMKVRAYMLARKGAKK
jgi:hypothetical protein